MTPGSAGGGSLPTAPGRPLPTTPQALATLLAPGPQLLLLLDYDGTLSDLASTPEAASTRPDTLAALQRLVRTTDTRVAIVSGRPLNELVARLPVPGLWLAGEHGAVLQSPAGAVEPLMPMDELSERLDTAETLARQVLGVRPGWRIERKGAAVAVHFRLVPPGEAQRLWPALVAAWEREAALGDLELLRGRMVLEVRSPGANKGRATRRLLATYPGALPVFVGDDVTDEDGFQAATRAGGLGILVAPDCRPTWATRRLAGPHELAHLLCKLAVARAGPVSNAGSDAQSVINKGDWQS